MSAHQLLGAHRAIAGGFRKVFKLVHAYLLVENIADWNKISSLDLEFEWPRLKQEVVEIEAF